jgi:hypothetical protein
MKQFWNLYGRLTIFLISLAILASEQAFAHSIGNLNEPQNHVGLIHYLILYPVTLYLVLYPFTLLQRIYTNIKLGSDRSKS